MTNRDSQGQTRIRDEAEVLQRIGEKVPCHIFQIEQHTPVTQFWKKVTWEVGIDKGHFMNGRAIRAGMAKQYENKRPQDVRMFLFSVTGRDVQEGMARWQWLCSAQDVHLNEMNESNYLYVIRDSDKVQLTPKLNLALAGRIAKGMVVLVASADIFDQFCDGNGEILPEHLLPLPARACTQPVETLKIESPIQIKDPVPNDQSKQTLLELAQRLNKDLTTMRDAFGDEGM